MKIKNYIFLLSAIVIIFFSFNCASVNENYDNPFDPLSNDYIPANPSFLLVSNSADTLVTLSWTDNSHGEKGFLVERSVGNSNSFSDLAEVPANTTNFKDHIILRIGTTYYYRVSAYTDRVRSNGRTQSSIYFYLITPSKPIITYEQNNSFKISWYDNDVNINGFVLEKSINNGEFYKVATLGKTVNIFNDADIDTSNSYSYRIKSFTRYNESEYSPITEIK
jgi:hypothetical protein